MARTRFIKNDPALSELGKKAAMLLSSAIFISKWIRDKTHIHLLNLPPTLLD
jgi:hypothetical protein